MKKYIFTLLSLAALSFTSCDDVLDRPQLTKPVDTNYWRSETDFRLYANECYPNYFVGYNNTWGVDYAPLRGYYFSDDNAWAGKQSVMENAVPSSRGSSSLSTGSDLWLTKYGSATWNFAWVRKINTMIDRLDMYGKVNLTEEAYNHWMGVARFFRAFEYHRLVWSFGDVPYFDKVFVETDAAQMYKDRTPRAEVMEKVYDDLKFAFENLRLSDGAMYLNKDIAAGFITRIMLYEGTWQKYHNLDQALAKKYLEFAKEAGDYVIGTGKYAISGDFRSLFGSQDLKGHKEMLMYRHYDAANATHHVASYSNGYGGQSPSPNLALAKSFLCNDGKPYEASAVPDAAKLDIKHMVKTRDPRFEATFWDEPRVQASTLLYACKFIDRTGPTYWNAATIPPQYGSMTNTNDAPVMRYSEVLLNWIEAKAELAIMGEAAVTQGDIDISINAIRNRDLDAEAIAKGVQKTAPMKLADITEAFAPDRDADVPALIWEIRRERRMEFVYEHTRLADIRRWKKLDYMDNNKYPDTMLGLWINLKEELPSYLEQGKDGKYTAYQVRKMDGTVVTYDGSNADDMVGFFVPLKAVARDVFGDECYLAPVGKAQIDQYADQGYKLSQTPGWENK
ncbi:RagB/SusD family nutrient uptake outer membrane protein [Bacteroides sp. ZJ-18]|uniref:RagB/SusD family nutrient uptake outer membrane protein n=1 Tax=Bacteroides sp. ZJ-18 TaxID=2709390 RepID=UPI0013EA29FF|nr:RagB/SusD family nutrient uptake outer membrane protein [Bacteroides sp. ZJ-18]QTO26952.1 RagB/SusD family nutrient uptake outer membrane protein [Bacteroides sp. ZJ-18]